MNFRNNDEYIIGFIDATIEEYEQANSFIRSKLESLTFDIEKVNKERTEVEIYFRVKDQKQEDDYNTNFILVPMVTTLTGFSALVAGAIEQIRLTIKEVQDV